MRVDLFDYELPPEKIARWPSAERSDARLLVVDPLAQGPGAFVDRQVRDLASVLPKGALVITNDTRVVPARLRGHKADTGGKVEFLLVERLDEGASGGGWSGLDAPIARWRALAKSSKPLRLGARVALGPAGELEAEIEGAMSEGGLVDLVLQTRDGSALASVLDRCGECPLPPYLERPAEAKDWQRYQTVYARAPGAIAAPTAGLHLSEEGLAELTRAGFERVSLTLHVGLGTFKPVTVDDLDQHDMHAEWVDVPAEVVAAVAAARDRGTPIVAIGTTTVRALESAADPERPGRVRRMSAPTRLLIQPGYRFRVVDALFTNFHLPRSTLLALVAAFAGRTRVLAAYRAAIERGYRFYSYGDAMLVTRRATDVEAS